MTRYISNSISKEELGELRARINTSGDPILLSELSVLWEQQPDEKIRNTYILNEAFQVIEHHTHTHTIRQHYRTFLRVAGILLLPLLCTVATYLYMDKQISPYLDNQVVVEAGYGERAGVVLPDGTRVSLNAGSHISYPQRFGKKVRQVKLSGEAFFEVAKNKGKKFIVHTEYIDVEVVGTSFNVYAYEKENTVEMVLLTGKVKVNTNQTPFRSFYIKPNEKISFDKQSGALKIKKTDTRFETAWLRNEIVFRSEKLENVFEKLERKYGVTIEKENFEQEKDLFTGSFDGKDLTGILDILKKHYRFHYKVSGNKIIIYGEK